MVLLSNKPCLQLFKGAVMKRVLFFTTMCLLVVSGCKKDEGGPTDTGSTTPFEFIAGRSWTYNGQSYETNGTPIPNSSLQTSLTVLTTGQTIGGIGNAAIMRMAYTQGTRSESENITVAYNQDKFMVYNGSPTNSNESPSLPGWSALFDFKKDVSVRSVFSFDSTYQIGMRSGQILRDRVRYNATIRYLGEEAVSAFNTSNISCSKYQFTFTYDAVVDTGGSILFNGNVLNATTTIWFSPSIGFVKVRGDGTQLFMERIRNFGELKIRHDLTQHSSLAVYYYRYTIFGVEYELLGLRAGTSTQAGYSIFDGFSKNF